MAYRKRNIKFDFEARLFYFMAYVERGMLYLESAKWLENRGRSKRGEMTDYSVACTKWHIFLRLYYFKTLWVGCTNEV